MSRSKFFKGAATFMLVLLAVFAFGQSNRKTLEKQKSKLKKDIEYTNQLLQETAKSKKASLNKLVLLDKKMDERNELIYTMNKELKLVSEQIATNQTQLESFEKDLERIKVEYAAMVRYAWKTRNDYDKIMFIFGAEDFNQAYKRIRYLQQYSDYRTQQVENMKRVEERVKEEQIELTAKKEEFEGLLADQKGEKSKITSEKKQIEVLYADLKDKESELKKEIKAKADQQNRLERAIAKAIEDEIRLASKNTEATVGTEWKITPEAAALANEFTSNKGTLPWPLEKGVITETYGLKSHPVLKLIKVQNNGITISTNAGSPVRAVFDGEVSSVVLIQGAGKAVIIRHGDYMTVYSNMGEVFVTKGDKVKTKQSIGVVRTENGVTELKFELRKGKDVQTLDPAYWLYKAR